MTLKFCAAGAVRFIVTAVLVADVSAFCVHMWDVIRPAGLYSSVIVCAVPAVPSPACAQSQDTARTCEPAAVVVTDTDGRPDAENAAATAPNVGELLSVHTRTRKAAAFATACVPVTVRATALAVVAVQTSTPPGEPAPPSDVEVFDLRACSVHASAPESATVKSLPAVDALSVAISTVSSAPAGAVNDAVVRVVPVAGLVTCGGDDASIARVTSCPLVYWGA